MTALSIKAFRGEVPRLSKRLIGDNKAQVAQNCKISTGDLEPLKALTLSHRSQIESTIQTLYQYEHDGIANWFVWDCDVDVVKSPIAQDYRGRAYYTGDGEPRMTTNADAISGGSNVYPAKSFMLGVYAPQTAPNVAASGGSGDNESRVYVWTWKTQYGEESAPSPAKTTTGKIDGTWTVSGFEDIPENSRSITSLVGLNGVCTITTASTYGLSAGDQLSISGSSASVLNAKFRIKEVVDATHFTIDCAYVGTITSATWTLIAGHNNQGMQRCIYRTSGTNTTFRLVAELPVGQTSYADTKPATELSINLKTLEGDLPPKRLSGLIGLPNGALAGFVDNELCFSEPYHPHLWPVAYRYSFSHKAVALSAVGNSVIVLTDGSPYLATGTHPSAVSVSQIETYAPCVSKRGVVDIGRGCIFPSNDGLYLAESGPVRNLTEGLFRLEEWADLTPSQFYGVYNDQKYYARYKNRDSQGHSLLVLDIAEPDSIVRINYAPDAMYSSTIDGKLYMAQGKNINVWDSDPNNLFQSYWQSKEFVLERPINFEVAQVYAEFGQLPVAIDPADLEYNQQILQSAGNVDGAMGADFIAAHAIGGSNLRRLNASSVVKVTFSLSKDGEIFFSTQVFNSNPFLLPSGYETDNISIHVSSNVVVHSVALAQTTREIKGIQ